MSKWVKFLDYGSGIHFAMAFLIGMPATAFGIFNLFIFPEQWALSVLLIPTGTYCILGHRYEDLSDWISDKYGEEQ